MKRSTRFFSTIIFSLLSFITIAQISFDGTPKSFYYNLDSDIPTKIIQPLTTDEVNQNIENGKNGTFYKIGKTITTEINFSESGKWSFLENGERICRLKVTSRNAQAIMLFYDKFILPQGSKLYIYSKDTAHIIGAFTDFNNPVEKNFSTEPVAGDEIIIEYNASKYTNGYPDIHIEGISYIYQGIKLPSKNNLKAGFGDSDSACEVNANCSEGNNWQNQKRGVVRILLSAGGSQGWCSGSLINTTDEDCTPYILTADHCGHDASTAEYNQWIFYFNYESPDCANPAAEGSLANSSITGCSVIAKGGAQGTAGSDFHLVLLNNNVPEVYNPHWNGWNRENIGATSGVSIHHPAGDIKKISTFSTTLTGSGWNGSGYDSHWRVNWIATTNGHGVTEGGSSGSPIFDQDGYIVGDLTGGSSYCSTPNSPDLYGKFSYSWDQNGTSSQERLRDWLDPTNTGVITLEGRDFCYGNEVHADFEPSLYVVTQGGTVDFTDMSNGNPTSWNWTFNGGNPQNSTLQNPMAIQFDTVGTFDIILLATNATTDDDVIKQITVVPPGPPISDFVGVPTAITVGQSVDFLDLTSGGPTDWEWTFQGGYPSSSTDQSPQDVYYYNTGLFTVSLSVSNPYGSDFITKTEYIKVEEELPIAAECDTMTNITFYDSLMVLPLEGGGYIPGQNVHAITEYADYFENPIVQDTPVVKYKYSSISALIIPVKNSISTINSSKVVFKIWDADSVPGHDTLPGADVIPGNLLGQQFEYISQMSPNIVHYLEFSNAINISGNFFVGYQVFYTTGDNFAVAMAKNRGLTGDNTLYMNYDSDWKLIGELQDAYLDSGLTSSLSIKPVTCKPLTIENDILDQDLIAVYPNPSSNKVYVDYLNNDFLNPFVEIRNMVGQTIEIPFETINSNQIILDFESVTTGIYFILIKSNNKVFNRKISIVD